jgi:hypothetical protein
MPSESLVKHVTFVKKSPDVRISLLLFMVACEAGFEDIIDDYFQDGKIKD